MTTTMRRTLLGLVLCLLGVVYLWLAYQTVAPGLASGDWVSFVGTVVFLAAGIAAVFAGINLARPRRR